MKKAFLRNTQRGKGAASNAGKREEPGRRKGEGGRWCTFEKSRRKEDESGGNSFFKREKPKRLP